MRQLLGELATPPMVPVFPDWDSVASRDDCGAIREQGKKCCSVRLFRLHDQPLHPRLLAFLTPPPLDLLRHDSPPFQLSTLR